MRILTPAEVKKLTGTADPADQVAALRRHGISPFVCCTTGRPRVTENAVDQAQLVARRDSFEFNMEAFR